MSVFNPPEGSIVGVSGVPYIVTDGQAGLLFPPPVLTETVLNNGTYQIAQTFLTGLNRQVTLQGRADGFNNGQWYAMWEGDEEGLPTVAFLWGLTFTEIRLVYTVNGCEYFSDAGVILPFPQDCDIVPNFIVQYIGDMFNAAYVWPDGLYYITSDEFNIGQLNIGGVPAEVGMIVGVDVVPLVPDPFPPIGWILYNEADGLYYVVTGVGVATALLPPINIAVEGTTITIEYAQDFFPGEDRDLIVEFLYDGTWTEVYNGPANAIPVEVEAALGFTNARYTWVDGDCTYGPYEATFDPPIECIQTPEFVIAAVADALDLIFGGIPEGELGLVASDDFSMGLNPGEVITATYFEVVGNVTLGTIVELDGILYQGTTTPGQILPLYPVPIIALGLTEITGTFATNHSGDTRTLRLEFTYDGVTWTTVYQDTLGLFSPWTFTGNLAITGARYTVVDGACTYGPFPITIQQVIENMRVWLSSADPSFANGNPQQTFSGLLTDTPPWGVVDTWSTSATQDFLQNARIIRASDDGQHIMVGAAGDDALRVSNDFGATWFSPTLDFTAGTAITDIHHAGGGVWWVVGSDSTNPGGLGISRVYVTEDNGANWNIEAGTLGEGANQFIGVFGFNANSAVMSIRAISGTGEPRLTTNKGASFTSSSTPGGAPGKFHLCQGGRLLLHDEQVPEPWPVLLSDDSGATWTATAPVGRLLSCVSFGPRIISAGGWISEDNGSTWAATRPDTWPVTFSGLNPAPYDFVSDLWRMIAIGTAGVMVATGRTGGVWLSRDGAATWSLIYPAGSDPDPLTPRSFTDIAGYEQP